MENKTLKYPKIDLSLIPKAIWIRYGANDAQILRFTGYLEGCNETLRIERDFLKAAIRGLDYDTSTAGV